MKSGTTCIRGKGVKEEYLTVQSFYQLQLRNGSDEYIVPFRKRFPISRSSPLLHKYHNFFFVVILFPIYQSFSLFLIISLSTFCKNVIWQIDCIDVSRIFICIFYSLSLNLLFHSLVYIFIYLNFP